MSAYAIALGRSEFGSSWSLRYGDQLFTKLKPVKISKAAEGIPLILLKCSLDRWGGWWQVKYCG